METLIADIPTSNLIDRLSEARDIKPSKLFPCGRTCERWGCITILARLNPGPCCYMHAADEFRPLRRSVA